MNEEYMYSDDELISAYEKYKKDRKDKDSYEPPMYHVVRRNDARRIIRDIFMTRNKARAEIYAKMYGGKVETIRKYR